MDIGTWLEGIGLRRYETVFQKNAVDIDVLGQLNEADLAQMGVALGDRKRFMRALAYFRTNEPPPLMAPIPRAARDDAERRMIAVVFVDLVNSTGLATRLDAEDWRDLLGAYIDTASDAVTAFGGHVLKILGDGVMALFGYPRAQENDAERAARASLAIQQALAELNARNTERGLPPLTARIGVDLGPVVVDATGEVFGDAPNLAARLQTVAEPGTILITQALQRQIAGLFLVEERGPVELKGVPGLPTIYRLVRVSGGRRRSSGRPLTPLVGREEELTALARRWTAARTGEGRFVLVVGEPGMGKTRLVDEFRERLRETPHTWVEWGAAQLLQNTPLHPVVEWGRARFGGEDLAPDRRYADLRLAMSQVHVNADELAPLIAPLLDIKLDRLPKLSPEELRRRQLAAIVDWMLAGARSQPMVLAVEDLHWADPTTLDLLAQLAERCAQSPILVIATARPEFRAQWPARAHHATLTLAPLDRSQISQMVGEIAVRAGFTREAFERLTERTGGVPLFVEEITQLLLDRDGQHPQAIPPTLQQSLSARLDRLGPAREVAMVAAVLGRTFTYPLLRSVSGMEDAGLNESLMKLTESGIFIADGWPPDAEYRFKHALIQDGAYETLLKSRRQALHRRVAETMRDDFASQAESEPEALAHHFALAGLDEEAVLWWAKAGEQAVRRSAFTEAIAHLGRAIGVAERHPLPSEPVAAARRVKLQSDYGTALAWSLGFGAPETKAAFARARELTAAAGQESERAATHYGVWVGQLVRAELASAREAAEAFLAEVESGGPSAIVATAHRCIGMTAWLQGDFGPSRHHLEAAIAMSNPERKAEGRKIFGQDTSVIATIYLAHTTWLTGEVQRSRQLTIDCVQAAEESAHLPTQVNAIDQAAILAVARGDFAAARPLAKRMAHLSDGPGLTMYSTMAALILSWCDARTHNDLTAVERVRAALDVYLKNGTDILYPLYHGLAAELVGEAGDGAEALKLLDGALDHSRKSGEQWSDALLHRIRGDLLKRLHPAAPARAVRAYEDAIAVAKAQNARSFGLIAALRLAQLLQAQGDSDAARDRLREALAGFAPTPEFPEVAEAMALLGVAEADSVLATAAK